MRGTAAIRAFAIVVTLGICAVAVRCGHDNQPTAPTERPAIPPDGSAPPPPAPSGVSQIFVGAGDIARCDALDSARQTARLLEGIGGTVFTLGDNALFGGTTAEFRDCYDTTWGRERSRTRPVLGNHEYEGGNGGGPYFVYFGANAGPSGLGYYSFDLGPTWHAVALNSNIPASAGSPQGQWLQSDLAASRAKCTIAYWHHPLFTSGQNGPQTFTRDFWRILFDADADVVLNGHDHLYERFGLQNPDGRSDAARGIRQFTVGTGGAMLYDFPAVAANSEVCLKAYGVLKLTLDSDRYSWEFIQVSGAIGDAGSGQCH